MKAHRWYQEVGAHITKVCKVTVSRAMMYPSEGEMKTAEHTYPQTYIEVHTQYGRACVTDFTGQSELSGFVGNDGTARNIGTWKKYGRVRGHGVAWMYAQKSGRGNRRVNANSRKCELACLAEVYARLTSTDHPWSEAARLRREEEARQWRMANGF